MPDIATANATSWRLLESSSITFEAVQAGAPFEGQFRQFQAQVRFAPDHLADSVFLVEIDLASVASGYGERDEILRGPEFFNVKVQPLATYRTTGFTKLTNGQFHADGILSLNGKHVPTAVTFTFTPANSSDSEMRLEGKAVVNRLDFNIGLGEWRDDKWIGHNVRVSFSLQLSVIPD